MKPPAFQFYPNDWLSSSAVTLMTPEQEGAYIRLLCYDWASDGIPDDDATLAALSRLGEGWFRGGSTMVRKCFDQHPEKPGFLTNARLQSEREKQQAWREKSREGGIKSAESRSKKGSRVVQPKVNRTVEPSGNTMSSSSSSKFSRPSVEEIAEYGKTLVPPFTRAGEFIDHYESNGWKVGKTSMKDWKASVRTWQRKQPGASTPNHQTRALWD
jgi:uncharacterized protein YdaU (DUF1376 family)